MKHTQPPYWVLALLLIMAGVALWPEQPQPTSVVTPTPQVTATPLQLPAFYLASFKGNGTDEVLTIATSSDGVTFTNQAVNYTPPTGETVRDPSVINYHNTLYLAHTNRGFQENYATFTIAKSTDGTTYTHHTEVDFSSLGKVFHVWAPEFFVDGDKVYAIAAVSLDGGATNQLYSVTAEDADLTRWSPPVKLEGLPRNTIDGTLVKVASTYYLFHKDEAKKVINVAKATNVVGPYTRIGREDFGAWGQWVEGPSVVRVGRSWRLYVDKYYDPALGLMYSDTTDDWTDGSAQWSKLAPVQGDVPTRHGTVLVGKDLLL